MADLRQAGGRIAGILEIAQRVIRSEPRGMLALRRILGDVHAIVQPGGRQHDIHARALFHREAKRRRDDALEVNGPVARVSARLIGDELPEARLPFPAQAKRSVLGMCVHRPGLPRRAGARRLAGRFLRFASATPIASRAQRASSSGSSSTSAGTCQ